MMVTRSFRLRYHNGEVVLRPGRFLIGRSTECDFALTDPLASRRHAALHVSEWRVILEDLGSQNGIFVNGERLREPRVLRHGDRISVGNETLTVLEVSGAGGFADEENPTTQMSGLPEEPRGLALLSRREREVLELLARGYTQREVGEQLHISIKTVESYRARVGEKLGLKSRVELVRFAIDHGLLPAPR